VQLETMPSNSLHRIVGSAVNRSAAANRGGLNRTSLIDSIVSTFTAQIASGELKDGDLLASQDDIARSMGVSRASLREALNRMSAMGLVEIRHGSGTFIRTAKPLDFVNAISPLLMAADRASVRELLVAQSDVEPLVAGLAAMNVSGDQLLKIEELLRGMREIADGDNVDDFMLLDMKFHTAIAESAGNRVLVKVLEIFCGAALQMAQGFRPALSGNTLAIQSDHEGIYDAVAAHDPAAARERMKSHISHIARLTTDTRSGA
jgi:GntR family transcriptional regulator, transcriptional repressor for pyruvate dehydrogenase complex